MAGCRLATTRSVVEPLPTGTAPRYVRLNVHSPSICLLASCKLSFIAAINLPDSTKNLPILARPKSVDTYTDSTINRPFFKGPESVA